MPIIKAQKAPVPEASQEASVEDVLATFCFYYQQYSFAEARRLPYVRVQQMLKVAKREHYTKMLDLLQVSIAPTSQKNYDNVLSFLKNKIKDLT